VQAPVVEWEDETLIEPGGKALVPTPGEVLHPLSPLYPAVSTFGRYEILGRLAVGGMAEVFLARELGHHHAIRHVAIKRILPQIADDATFVEMFLDEARLAVQLNHPNICHIYDFGELEEAYFIAMEWVNGVSLGKIIRRAREHKAEIPVAVAIKITAHIAEALHYAHQARDGMGRPMNIVHRDVSPQNIMVRFDGVVKLLDFGIAKNASQTSQTEAGVVKGKFSYMAPEQCLGRALDGRTDIFALGSCIYEALTGNAAFRRGSDLDTMRAIVHEAPKPIASVRPDVPDALIEIVDRALAKDPKDRYQTAGDLYVALERWLAEKGEFVRAMHISQFVERLMPGEAQHSPLTQSSPSAPRLIDDSLGTLSPPPKGAQKAAGKVRESTVDVHISVLGDDQPAKTIPRDSHGSMPTSPRALDTAPSLLEDEGPTEQLGADQLEAVLGHMMREPVASKTWMDDDATTDEVPGGAVVQPHEVAIVAGPPARPGDTKPLAPPKPVLHTNPQMVHRPSGPPTRPSSPPAFVASAPTSPLQVKPSPSRSDPPHVSLAGAPKPPPMAPLLPPFDATHDAPTSVLPESSASASAGVSTDKLPVAAAMGVSVPSRRKGRGLQIALGLAALVLIAAVAGLGVWVGLHPEAVDGMLASGAPGPIAAEPPPAPVDPSATGGLAEANAPAESTMRRGAADRPLAGQREASSMEDPASASTMMVEATQPGPVAPEQNAERTPADEGRTGETVTAPEAEDETVEAPDPADPVAETPPPVEPPRGSGLLVRSTPAGARVRLNNRMGTTPYTFETLRPGMYTLTVVKPGFEPSRQRVRVAADQGVVEIEVELRRLPAAPPPAVGTGTLHVTTNEPATVYVGGRLLGRTPVREQVPAGTARLRLVDGEGQSHIRSVQVREGQVTPVYLVLSP
jgi:serine/threonine-protein kinase